MPRSPQQTPSKNNIKFQFVFPFSPLLQFSSRKATVLHPTGESVIHSQHQKLFVHPRPFDPFNMGKGESQKVQTYPQEPYLLSVEDILSKLKVSTESGLSGTQAQQNQQKYGENKLSGEGGTKWYSLLLKQISNAIILVLVLAMALAYGVTDCVEGRVITAVIFLNVTLGFNQELQAE